MPPPPICCSSSRSSSPMFLSSCSTDWPASLAAPAGSAPARWATAPTRWATALGSVGDGAGSVGDGRSDGGVAAAEPAADGGCTSKRPATAGLDADNDLADCWRDAAHDLAEVTGVTRGQNVGRSSFGRAQRATRCLAAPDPPAFWPVAASPPLPSARCTRTVARRTSEAALTRFSRSSAPAATTAASPSGCAAQAFEAGAVAPLQSPSRAPRESADEPPELRPSCNELLAGFDELPAPTSAAHFHSSCYLFVGLTASLRECASICETHGAAPVCPILKRREPLGVEWRRPSPAGLSTAYGSAGSTRAAA